MKQFWICQWEVAPGNGEETLCFSTLEAAKFAMRQKIAEHLDLSDLLNELQPEGADCLRKYLSDPTFPRTPEECPDILAEWDDEDDYSEFIMNSAGVWLKYPYGLAPQLRTNLMLDESDEDTYYLDFCYDGLWKSTHNGISSMSIYIHRGVDYGTSAYPILVLMALRKEPATQRELISRIAFYWHTGIDRKAVGRHLKMLEDMGYPVRHNEQGYYYEGERTAPKADMEYTPNSYPLMLLEVLKETPQTIEAMVKEIYKQYGAVVDRKALGRHLKLLRALGFGIERTKGGYCIHF